MLTRCKVCGAEYDCCAHCIKVQSWRVHTDTADHYYIWLVLMTYQSNHNARAAYEALQKRGVGLANLPEFKPDIQEIMREIFDAVFVEDAENENSAMADNTENTNEESD